MLASKRYEIQVCGVIILSVNLSQFFLYLFQGIVGIRWA